MEQLLIGKREAADGLAISVRALERLIANDEINVRRIGRRVLVSRAELERYAEGREAEPARA